MRRTLVLTSTALSCAWCVPLSPAAAQTLYQNESGGTAEVYGQLNPTIQSFDDGVDTTTNLVDNTRSNSRVGLWLREPTAAGLVSFNFEAAVGAPQSSAFSQTNEPSWEWDRTDIRKVDLSLETEAAGTFTFGQGSMATDGVAGNDFSGTTLAHNVTISDGVGGFFFRNADGTLSEINIGSVNGDFDGSRRGRIRYDTPSFSGFTLSAAYGRDILSKAPDADEDEFYDIALSYRQEFQSFDLRASIGYAVRDRFQAGKDKDTVGSLSVAFDTGFNATLAAGSRDDGGSYGYGKLGYKATWTSLGTTALSVDYYAGSDFNGDLNNDDFKAYGIGVTQKLDDFGVEVYFAAQRYDLSATGRDFQESTSYFLGTRWQF